MTTGSFDRETGVLGQGPYSLLFGKKACGRLDRGRAGPLSMAMWMVPIGAEIQPPLVGPAFCSDCGAVSPKQGAPSSFSQGGGGQLSTHPSVEVVASS